MFCFLRLERLRLCLAGDVGLVWPCGAVDECQIVVLLLMPWMLEALFCYGTGTQGCNTAAARPPLFPALDCKLPEVTKNPNFSGR